MTFGSKTSGESITSQKGPKGKFTGIFPVLFSFLVGFYATIHYTVISFGDGDAIQFGALIGLFILPPLVGHFVFANSPVPPRPKYFAFGGIVFIEIGIWCAFYFMALVTPGARADASDQWLLAAFQLFLVGISSAFFALLACSLFKKFVWPRT